MTFHSFYLDPMTMILKFNKHMVKIYLHTENEVPSHSSSKVIARADRQTPVKLLPTRVCG